MHQERLRDAVGRVVHGRGDGGGLDVRLEASLAQVGLLVHDARGALVEEEPRLGAQLGSTLCSVRVQRVEATLMMCTGEALIMQ